MRLRPSGELRLTKKFKAMTIARPLWSRQFRTPVVCLRTHYSGMLGGRAILYLVVIVDRKDRWFLNRFLNARKPHTAPVTLQGLSKSNVTHPGLHNSKPCKWNFVSALNGPIWGKDIRFLSVHLTRLYKHALLQALPSRILLRQQQRRRRRLLILNVF